MPHNSASQYRIAGNFQGRKPSQISQFMLLFAKVSFTKFGGVASFGAPQTSNPRKFSPSKVFSLESFPLYGTSNSTAILHTRLSYTMWPLTEITLYPAVERSISCRKKTSAVPHTGGRQTNGLLTCLGPASYTTHDWLVLSTTIWREEEHKHDVRAWRFPCRYNLLNTTCSQMSCGSGWG